MKHGGAEGRWRHPVSPFLLRTKRLLSPVADNTPIPGHPMPCSCSQPWWRPCIQASNHYWVPPAALPPLPPRDEAELSQCPTFCCRLDPPPAPRTWNARPAFLQVHSVLVSHHLIPGCPRTLFCPGLCFCSSSVRQIRRLAQLGEKHIAFSWLFFSWISFPTWFTGWLLLASARGYSGVGTSSWDQWWFVWRWISSLNHVSRWPSTHQCQHRGGSRNKMWEKMAWPAAWVWVDLIKPTSVTKKEPSTCFRLLWFPEKSH